MGSFLSGAASSQAPPSPSAASPSDPIGAASDQAPFSFVASPSDLIGAPSPMDQGRHNRCVAFAIATCLKSMIHLKYGMIFESSTIAEMLTVVHPCGWHGVKISEVLHTLPKLGNHWIYNHDVRVRVEVKWEKLSFPELYSRTSKLEGYSSAVCVVRQGSRMAHRKHAVAASDVMSRKRCIVGLNSWGEKEPQFYVHESNFLESLSIDPQIIECQSNAPLPIPKVTELFLDRMSKLASPLPLLQPSDVLIMDRVHQLMPSSPVHVQLDAMHHICDMVEDDHNLCSVLVNDGGVDAISSMLSTISYSTSAYTLAMVCFHGGATAQDAVDKQAVDTLLKMAAAGSSLDTRFHAVQALGMLCLDAATHVEAISHGAFAFVSLLKGGLQLNQDACVMCAALAIGRATLHAQEGRHVDVFKQAGIHLELLDVWLAARPADKTLSQDMLQAGQWAAAAIMGEPDEDARWTAFPPELYLRADMIFSVVLEQWQAPDRPIALPPAHVGRSASRHVDAEDFWDALEGGADFWAEAEDFWAEAADFWEDHTKTENFWAGPKPGTSKRPLPYVPPKPPQGAAQQALKKRKTVSEDPGKQQVQHPPASQPMSDPLAELQRLEQSTDSSWRWNSGFDLDNRLTTEQWAQLQHTIWWGHPPCQPDWIRVWSRSRNEEYYVNTVSGEALLRKVALGVIV